MLSPFPLFEVGSFPTSDHSYPSSDQLANMRVVTDYMSLHHIDLVVALLAYSHLDQFHLLRLLQIPSITFKSLKLNLIVRNCVCGFANIEVVSFSTLEAVTKIKFIGRSSPLTVREGRDSEIMQITSQRIFNIQFAVENIDLIRIPTPRF